MSTRIFLASSMELKADRAAFRELIMQQNNAWHDQGAFLQVVGWEYFLDAMSRTRLQDEYNAAIRQCDVFVMLFHTKVGKYTREEFEVAHAQLMSTGKPLVYAYFKTAEAGKPVDAADQQSLEDFRARLKSLGHFETRYENVEGLQLNFLQQLHRLANQGVIDFAPPDGAPAITQSYSATAAGGSAIAQGDGATALGKRAVQVQGNNHAPINTGTQHIDTGGGAYVGGGVHIGTGDFIGRDRTEKPK